MLDALLEAGVSEAAVVSPADAAEEIKACLREEAPAGISLRHLLSEPRGEDEALAEVAEFVGEAPCVLHHANGLLGQELSPFAQRLEQEQLDGLLLVYDDGSASRRLKLVPERVPAAFALDAVAAGFAGVCLLGPQVLGRLPNPERGAQLNDFGGLVEQLARDGGRAEVCAVRRWRRFTGDVHDLLDMNRTLLDRLGSDTLSADHDGNRFEGPVAIHPTACVTSSTIIGPVMIGADTLIADSYIGPHTSIGERVRIEGAELERSIVLADASVLHVGGRLVASVVGRNARVFRDFTMPRALRLQVGDGDEVALC